MQLNLTDLIVQVVTTGLLAWGLYLLGQKDSQNRVKQDVIRDLMTYRGDRASGEFRRALNKVSVTFHNDREVREKVRNLHEAINDGNFDTKQLDRKIVGLIYTLCKKNGFKGLTEYDIDQAFPESRQEPQGSNPTPANISRPTPPKAPLVKETME